MHYWRIRTLDVHSFRAQKNVGNLENVEARPFINRAIADICDSGGHPVILLPDEGAQRYGYSGALQCTKRRDPATGRLSGFEVPDFDRSEALIVDDICDGGGTFIGLAKELNRWSEGASALAARANTPYPPLKKLYLYVTHGIFSRGLAELLKYFEKIYTTNSLNLIHLVGLEGANRVEVYDCEKALLEDAVAPRD